jgi:hypothetical protein
MTGSDHWEDGVEVVLGEFWVEAWFEHPVIFWTYHFNLVLSVLFLLFMCLFVYLELLLISISLLAVAFYCVFVTVCPHLIFPLPLDMYSPVLCIVLACPVSFPLSSSSSFFTSVGSTNQPRWVAVTNERTNERRIVSPVKTYLFQARTHTRKQNYPASSPCISINPVFVFTVSGTPGSFCIKHQAFNPASINA